VAHPNAKLISAREALAALSDDADREAIERAVRLGVTYLSTARTSVGLVKASDVLSEEIKRLPSTAAVVKAHRLLVGIALQTLQRFTRRVPNELVPLLDAQIPTVLRVTGGDENAIDTWLAADRSVAGATVVAAKAKKGHDDRRKGADEANKIQWKSADELKARVQAAWRAEVAKGTKLIIDIVAAVCDAVPCSEPTAYKYRPDKPTKNR
jgi:hypothetical protein